MRVGFQVPGEPQGKARAKSTKGGIHYTPDNTVLYENLIKMEYQRQCGDARFPSNAMLDMRIAAFYTIPKSAIQKKQQAMKDMTIRPTKKPDADNVLKVVADALNQIAYRDDAQIVDAQIRKYYGEAPRLIITIQQI